MSIISRRQFLYSSTFAAGSLCGGNWAVAADETTGDWSFPLLGDLHFDRLEHHDHEWLAKEHPGDVAQVENYSRITRELMPRLLQRVGAVTRQLLDEKKHIPFVLQLGDLLEGLCGTPALAARHAREAIDFIRRAQSQVPWVMTKGNHDVTGPGATEAFDQLLLPFLSEEIKSRIAEARYTLSRHGTLIVFYDAYDRGSLDCFEKVLEEVQPQRLIVAIHPPVVPYNARSSWHIYSSAKQEAMRTRLLNLLGKHRALVLCGHLHKFCLLTRRTEHGPFVQLALSSVASSADGRVRNELNGVQHYSPDLVDLEPKHAPETVAARRGILTAERPFIEHYEYADTWGHAVVRLSDAAISADVFRGFDERPWKQLKLNAPS